MTRSIENANLELRRENQRLRELLDAQDAPFRLGSGLLETLGGISEGLTTIDRDGRITFANDAASRLLHRNAAELLGRRLVDVLPGTADSDFERRCERARATGEAVAFESYMQDLDCWFEVRVYPTNDHLVMYFHDVSAERAQRSQLKLLEAAVARLNDMVLITEAEPLEPPGPRVIYVNEAFLARTGFSRERVLGNTLGFLQGPATDAVELQRVAGALAACRPVRSELVYYTRDRKPYRVEMEVVPIVDEQGQPTHFVSVQRDVTEQRELKEKLQRSQRLDAVGQLTGGVAHDFNNLLTVILGNADLLAEGLPVEDPRHHLAVMTRTAAERGAELTSHLLAFARRQNLDPSATDVNELLGGMHTLLSRTLGEHIEIALLQGEHLWHAMVDGPQLESAVLNLCLNARDAMSQGGQLTLATGNVYLDGSDHIHQGEVSPGEYVTITVTDTGAGMPPEIVEHAFEPFFTTKETGKGSGLGLSMVYGFIKQSAGHVSIDSVPGRGTSIKLYLPRAEADVGQTEGSRTAPRMEGGSERVLLVEDDDVVRSFVTAELEALGYQVVSVANGPMALNALRQQGAFDLLFTDVMMPGGMNGRELAEAALEFCPDLPVLFTSGYTEEAIGHNGNGVPGQESSRIQSFPLLQKPYRRAELAAKVRQALALGGGPPGTNAGS